MDAQEMIFTRRSTRNYLQKPVEQALPRTGNEVTWH